MPLHGYTSQSDSMALGFKKGRIIAFSVLSELRAPITILKATVIALRIMEYLVSSWEDSGVVGAAE